jgi:hypothetical protein
LHNAAILQANARGVNALCSAPAEAIKTPGGRGSISASLQCYLPTSSRAAKIFQERGGTRGQGNESQGNVGHSIDTHSPDKAVLAKLGVLWVERAAQPFGCGSAALCLGVFALNESMSIRG